MIRRVLLAFIGVGAVVLVPWTTYLAGTLPDDHGRLAWVGFDIALACCFAVATWLGARRRRGAVPAHHRDDFGPWGKGERATAHLTEAEYHELATRYCLLRTGRAPGTREVAIRFYAFPVPQEAP